MPGQDDLGGGKKQKKQNKSFDLAGTKLASEMDSDVSSDVEKQRGRRKG